MTTVKNNQQTYFTNDSKHRRSTYMVKNEFSSHIKFVRYMILIAQNRKMIEDGHLMSKEQLDTICGRVDTFREISSSDIFHGKKAVKADTNKTSPNVGTIHSGDSSDPLEASQDADNYSRQLKLIWNIFYKMFSLEERQHMYVYFLTISKKNCSAGQLLPELRGSEARGNHLTDNFRKNVKKVLDFIRYHYPVLGGVSKTEITINKVSLLEELVNDLFHDHQHILLITKSPIDVHKLRHGNYYSRFIFNKVREVFGRDSVDKLAFDCRPVTVKDGNLGDAISEISKYSVKPQMYKNLQYVSEDDVKNNRFNEFHLKSFAELRGATYNLHLKGKFEIFDKVDKFIGRLGRIKPAVRAAIANCPDFSIENRRTFGKVLSQEGLLVWTNGQQERGHWKLLHFNPMDDKTFLYSNRQNISNVLVGSQQLNYLHTALHAFDTSKIGVKKDFYFDRMIDYLDSVPFLRSVDDLSSWISSVADKKMEKAKSYLYKSISFTSEEFHAYQMKKNDANDLYRLVKCIKKYSDEHGVVRLGCHTNPDYKFKVYKWVQTYKGALSYLSCDISRGWKFWGALHNSQKSIVDSFSSSEQSIYRRAMKIADKSLNYLEISPRPREMVCLDEVGSFLSCDASKYKYSSLKRFDSDTYIDKDTGELITIIDENNYSRLTAPEEDIYNWSKDGTDFDIDLFSNIKDFKDINDDICDALTTFTKN